MPPPHRRMLKLVLVVLVVLLSAVDEVSCFVSSSEGSSEATPGVVMRRKVQQPQNPANRGSYFEPQNEEKRRSFSERYIEPQHSVVMRKVQQPQHTQDMDKRRSFSEQQNVDKRRSFSEQQNVPPPPLGIRRNSSWRRQTGTKTLQAITAEHEKLRGDARLMLEQFLGWDNRHVNFHVAKTVRFLGKGNDKFFDTTVGSPLGTFKMFDQSSERITQRLTEKYGTQKKKIAYLPGVPGLCLLLVYHRLLREGVEIAENYPTDEALKFFRDKTAEADYMEVTRLFNEELSPHYIEEFAICDKSLDPRVVIIRPETIIQFKENYPELDRLTAFGLLCFKALDQNHEYLGRLLQEELSKTSVKELKFELVSPTHQKVSTIDKPKASMESQEISNFRRVVISELQNDICQMREYESLYFDRKLLQDDQRGNCRNNRVVKSEEKVKRREEIAKNLGISPHDDFGRHSMQSFPVTPRGTPLTQRRNSMSDFSNMAISHDKTPLSEYSHLAAVKDKFNVRLTPPGSRPLRRPRSLSGPPPGSPDTTTHDSPPLSKYSQWAAVKAKFNVPLTPPESRPIPQRRPRSLSGPSGIAVRSDTTTHDSPPLSQYSQWAAVKDKFKIRLTPPESRRIPQRRPQSLSGPSGIAVRSDTATHDSPRRL